MIILDESVENLQIEIDKRFKRLDKIEQFLKISPLEEVIRLRIDFQELIKKHGIMSEIVEKFIKENKHKEKELLKQAELRTTPGYLEKITNERVKLHREINAINSYIALKHLRSEK